MPKTVVGLFENPDHVDDVVCDIEALGFARKTFARKAVRAAKEEPTVFDLTGVMSFPCNDSEVNLIQALTRIRAGGVDVRAYLEGLRHGDSLVFATGSDDKVAAAADTMNRHGAVDVEETTDPEPRIRRLCSASVTQVRGYRIVA
jgi:hypothetical protein